MNNSKTAILYWTNYSTLAKGGQKSLFYILRDIDKTKYAPVLACREEGELTAKVRELGINVELLKLPKAMRPWYIFDIFNFMLNLVKLIDKHNIAIIHSEELTVVFMAFFVKLVRPVLTIWHVRVNWDTPVQKKIALLISDAVICVSHAVADSFKSSSKKLYAVCNGINADEFKPGGDKMASPLFGGTDVLIGQIGTLAEDKKFHVFLKSAPAVLKSFPSVKFLVIGQGEEKYTLYLKKLAKELNIENNVIFWGEEANIVPLINRLDIVCLLSKHEGLSRTLLEAMALEKTILSSDIAQNRELIIHGQTGLNARIDSAADTALQLNRLLSDKGLSLKLARNARQYVSKVLSLEKTLHNIYDVYNSLLKNT
jgi:glycosyltransferase involved in cell wall biosynthesis